MLLFYSETLKQCARYNKIHAKKTSLEELTFFTKKTLLDDILSSAAHDQQSATSPPSDLIEMDGI